LAFAASARASATGVCAGLMDFVDMMVAFINLCWTNQLTRANANFKTILASFPAPASLTSGAPCRKLCPL
jgi:hypothetical protein